MQFTSSAWHPDRVGPQFDRQFIIHVIKEGFLQIGATKIESKMLVKTAEVNISAQIPEGIKPGKTFAVEALDGQLIPMTCPKGSGPGDVLKATLTSPVLVDGAVLVDEAWEAEAAL